MNEEKENITLEDFLNHFDSSYNLYKDENYPNGYIQLIDNQGANLGDICNEKYSYSKEGVLDLIDRLDNYYEDYIFNGIKETLEQEHNIDTSNMEWEKLYSLNKLLNLNYDMDILPYIFGEKELVL